MSSVTRYKDGTHNVAIDRDDVRDTVERVLTKLLDKGIIETYELPFYWDSFHIGEDGRRYPG